MNIHKSFFFPNPMSRILILMNLISMEFVKNFDISCKIKISMEFLYNLHL